MELSRIKDMSRDDLLKLAVAQGCQVHPQSKKETIVESILEAVLASQKPKEQSMQHVAEKPVAPVICNSSEDIERTIASIKERQPAFEALYNESERTWHFRCKGAEECGNFDIPLRIIRRCAEMVARGRVAPLGLTKEFSDISDPRHYTNTVLLGQ